MGIRLPNGVGVDDDAAMNYFTRVWMNRMTTMMIYDDTSSSLRPPVCNAAIF
jgi:hypothetical protein